MTRLVPRKVKSFRHGGGYLWALLECGHERVVLEESSSAGCGECEPEPPQSRLHVERGLAWKVRRLAEHEKRGLSELLEDMLSVYVEQRWPVGLPPLDGDKGSGGR